ncbi:stage II sporulation protein M [Candidatus Woesearchaeota archaeon]|jgi:uncharacterized membrane protein SpoIIM required for sporulation|nr:stage II sporulation protein M [Candidatus Woesearchaeota archaeon]
MIYATMGVFLSLWVFEEQATIVMVLLTVIAAVPLMYNTLKFEEKKDIEMEGEGKLLKEHSKALMAFMFLFLGMAVAFSLLYLILPADTVVNLFSSQTSTISEINAKATTGHEVISGSSYSEGLLLRIFSNNVKVMLFCVFFSFFYGAGAIFILAWNASVIAAAIGNFVRTHLSSYATELGMVGFAGYLQVYGLGLARYFIHGIPEILSYFIGGLAGGLISVAVIRHDFSTKSFGKVLRDATDLLLIGIALLAVAAIVEVYVTPRIISF